MVLERALKDEHVGFGKHKLEIPEEALKLLAEAADGDARRALNFLEMAVDLAPKNDDKETIALELVKELLAGGSARRFDKRGEAFYDQISALHKSVRGSDPMRRYIGSRACSTAAATRCTSPGAWCAWPRKTSATPTRARCA